MSSVRSNVGQKHRFMAFDDCWTKQARVPPNGKTFELVLTACAQAEEEEDWSVSKGEWWWVEPQSQRRLKGLLMMWHWHVQSHVVGGIAVTRVLTTLMMSHLSSPPPRDSYSRSLTVAQLLVARRAHHATIVFSCRHCTSHSPSPCDCHPLCRFSSQSRKFWFLDKHGA
ncbi:hypothetical protein JHK87_009620 [Glycine soja]|nr:hypothetical protein JHK87_009620 [Glycine soja]